MRRELGSSRFGYGSIIGIACITALASSANAQRAHVNGLIGEPPDVSNWPHPAAPDANPFPRSTAPVAAIKYRNQKAALGKALFWDEQVSIDNTVSCGTCHLTEIDGTDGRMGAFHPSGNQGAPGVIRQAVVLGNVDYGFTAPPSANIGRQPTGLHTPTMIGSYVFNRLFWDMRAGPTFRDELGVVIPNFGDWAASEEQAVGPVISEVEMGHQNMLWGQNLIQAKIGDSYPLALVDPLTIPPDIAWIPASGLSYANLFDNIFFADPQFGGIQGVTRERFAMAIAHYERTLIPDQAPIDTGTMTPLDVQGFNLMRTSGCFACHSASGNPTLTVPGGKLANPFDNPFSDGQFHNIGFGFVKTPTIRNFALQKKFFSTGNGNAGVNTIDAVIQFYDNQPGILGFTGTGPGGSLTAAEFKAVKSFFTHGLVDKRVATRTFPFDRPQLASERADFNPFEGNEYGNGTAGPSGLIPEIIANAPPLVTKPGITPNPWFKIGVGNAPAGVNALIMLSPNMGAGPVIWVGPLIAIGPAIVTNAFGIGTVHLASPPGVGAIGVPFFAQWMVSDAGGFAFSDAAKFTPFQF